MICLLLYMAGKGVVVSPCCYFQKGDFLLEYTGALKHAEESLAVTDTYVYEFSYKRKTLW